MSELDQENQPEAPKPETVVEETDQLRSLDELNPDEESPAAETVNATQAEMLFAEGVVTEQAHGEDSARAELKALLEAVVYVTDEPLTAQQIAAAVGRPLELVKELLDELVADYSRPDRGLTVREVAGGYKMATKPEHHEPVRTFVKNLRPPLKLSLPALETLAVIAYKQPITAPEIMEIRGVQGAGVLKTLLDRKLVTTAGRKNVVGKPILYKTTKDFLVQFGLKDLAELPTLKEFEELSRLSIADPDAEIIPDVVDGTEGTLFEEPVTAGSADASGEKPEANPDTQDPAKVENGNG